MLPHLPQATHLHYEGFVKWWLSSFTHTLGLFLCGRPPERWVFFGPVVVIFVWMWLVPTHHQPLSHPHDTIHVYAMLETTPPSSPTTVWRVENCLTGSKGTDTSQREVLMRGHIHDQKLIQYRIAGNFRKNNIVCGQLTSTKNVGIA